MNFVLTSPQFPKTYYKFAAGLKKNGFNVLGIGDTPYAFISEELKGILSEYYYCPGMNDLDAEFQADFVKGDVLFVSGEVVNLEDFLIDLGLWIRGKQSVGFVSERTFRSVEPRHPSHQTSLRTVIFAGDELDR